MGKGNKVINVDILLLAQKRKHIIKQLLDFYSPPGKIQCAWLIVSVGNASGC